MPFESDLELRHRPGHGRWKVVRPLIYCHYTPSARLPAGYQPRAVVRIVVPVGYLTDLTSWPSWVRRLIDPRMPKARRPSAVHDFIYTHLTHRFTRAQADRIFYDALREEGAHPALAWLMWKAVRLAGRGNWRA